MSWIQKLNYILSVLSIINEILKMTPLDKCFCIFLTIFFTSSFILNWYWNISEIKCITKKHIDHANHTLMLSIFDAYESINKKNMHIKRKLQFNKKNIPGSAYLSIYVHATIQFLIKIKCKAVYFYFRIVRTFMSYLIIYSNQEPRAN